MTMANIFYEIVHLSWGNDDERTGYYLQQVVVAYTKGAPSHVASRKPVARFVGDSMAEATQGALDMSQIVRQGGVTLLPSDWDFKRLPPCGDGGDRPKPAGTCFSCMSGRPCR